MITLYDYGPSGNCYKVRLLFSLLRIKHLRVDVDVRKGETRTEHFLKNISPNGRVPVIIIPPDYVHKLANPPNVNPSPSTENLDEASLEQSTILTESNAILTFFSDGTPLFPSNPIERAKIMQWLFWEQFSHEPNFAPLRFWITLLGKGEDAQYLDQIVERQRKGYEALDIMENHLSKEDWFVADKFTIADIALYPYTHCAEEAGYSIDSFPKVKAWLHRVKNMPGFVPIDD